MAAGLNDISGGGIVLDGREITGAGPDKGVVFQSPSLMPWLTARENVMAGVARVYPHATRAERREIVDYYLARVGLGRQPRQAGGGNVERHETARRHRPRLCALSPNCCCSTSLSECSTA